MDGSNASRPSEESNPGLCGQGKGPMGGTDSTVAHQIARAASAFEQGLTGHAPESVAVVLSGDTLVVTLRGALSAAEKDMAQTPAGAARVQEYHRQLFANSLESLRREIRRITGVEVREAATEVEPGTGAVVRAFTTGTVVQVFLLARDAPSDAWSGDGWAAGGAGGEVARDGPSGAWSGDGPGESP